MRREHARDALQHRVAGVVTERVVHLLEVVDVEQQHADREELLVARGAGLLDPLDEGAAVEEAGERVGRSEAACLGDERGHPQRSAELVRHHRDEAAIVVRGAAAARRERDLTDRHVPNRTGSRMGGVDHSASTARLSAMMKASPSSGLRRSGGGATSSASRASRSAASLQIGRACG